MIEDNPIAEFELPTLPDGLNQHEEWLLTISYLCKHKEARYIWYKKQLEIVFKDKVHFPPLDEFVIWYKSHLREMKNLEETGLREMKNQLKWERICGYIPTLHKE